MNGQKDPNKEITKKPSPRKKAVPVITALAVAAAGLAAYKLIGADGNAQQPGAGAPPAFVRVQTVTSDKTVRDSIVQNMSIDAVNRLQMTPRVSGRLERLHVKQGDLVKTGSLIATLEHEQQDALIGATEAQLASAAADTKRAYAEMMNAKTNLDRYERLVKEGFSTQQQYDTIKTTYESTLASHNASLAKERQAAAEIVRVKSTRMDYIMRASIDGTVLNDYALTPGAMISPSSPIVDIADLSRLKATLRVPELKIFIVKPGMPVSLKFDALPGEEFMGEVTRIDPYVDPSTRTSTVEIELDNAATGNRLRPGMFGQASIVEREFKDAILIPQSALNGEQGSRYVFVEKDAVATAREVKTGLRQGNDIQITEGLAPGERVIVFGGANLKDGESVIIQNGTPGQR